MLAPVCSAIITHTLAHNTRLANQQAWKTTPRCYYLQKLYSFARMCLSLVLRPVAKSLRRRHPNICFSLSGLVYHFHTAPQNNNSQRHHMCAAHQESSLSAPGRAHWQWIHWCAPLDLPAQRVGNRAVCWLTARKTNCDTDLVLYLNAVHLQMSAGQILVTLL